MLHEIIATTLTIVAAVMATGASEVPSPMPRLIVEPQEPGSNVYLVNGYHWHAHRGIGLTWTGARRVIEPALSAEGSFSQVIRIPRDRHPRRVTITARQLSQQITEEITVPGRNVSQEWRPARRQTRRGGFVLIEGWSWPPRHEVTIISKTSEGNVTTTAFTNDSGGFHALTPVPTSADHAQDVIINVTGDTTNRRQIIDLPTPAFTYDRYERQEWGITATVAHMIPNAEAVIIVDGEEVGRTVTDPFGFADVHLPYLDEGLHTLTVRVYHDEASTELWAYYPELH